MPSYALAGSVVFAVSAAATLAVRAAARRRGWLVLPRPDRWHTEPTALFGGLGVLAGLVVGLLGFTPMTWPLPGLLALAVGMGAVGLADDVADLRPQTKLIAQLSAGLLLYLLDFHFNAALPWLLDLAVVVFWVVAITNAMNLLDNMNGLCAGTAVIAAAFRCLFYLEDGNAQGAMLSVVFAAAVLGFLVFNFPRASIFLGDTGSFVVGFFLAAINLTSGEAYSRGVFSVLVFPVLALAIPIFDTAFVSVVRWFSGRAVSEGGRDHTSHRLVAVGLSETMAVLILYGISAASGAVAYVVYRGGFSWAWFLGALLVLGLLLFGIFLASVKVYAEDRVPWDEARRARGGFTLVTDFQYKRLVLWVLVDTLTILVAWYATFLVRFGDDPQWPERLSAFASSAPLVLLSVLVGIFARGLYRADWQHFSLHEIRAIGSGAALGLAVTAVVLAGAGRGGEVVWPVFVVAFGALVLMLAGTRLFIRSLAELLRRQPRGAERILIYGAGAGGALALRELRGNQALGKAPVGFIDDDPLRKGMTIQGVPVLGGLGALEELVGRHRIEAVVLSTGKLPVERQERLARLAAQHGVRLYQLQIAVVALDADAAGGHV
jgi:UDP-GlcNAc:undecaprenyl-phosphate GlcNAc-1-phosphate transferase